MATTRPERYEAREGGMDSQVDPAAASALVAGFLSFPVPMTIDREDGRIVQANEAFLSLVGVEAAEASGQRVSELGLRDLRPQARGRAAARSTRLLMEDGRVLRCESKRIDSGGPDMFVSTYALESGQANQADESGRPDALEYISEGVIFLDAEGLIESANGSAQALLHFSLEESRGHPLSDNLYNLAIPEAAEMLESVMSRGKSEQAEFYIDDDGMDKWLSLDIQRGDAGTIVVASDHTKLRNNESVARQGEQQYKRLVELSNDGIWSVDEEFETTFVSPRMAEILGRDKTSLSGQYFYEMMDEEVAEKVQKALSPIRSGLTAQTRAVIKAQERDVEVGIRATPILNEDLEFCGALMLITDMTALHKAKEKVESLGAELEAMRQVCPAGILEMDQDERVSSACTRIEELSGRSNHSLVGSDMFDLFKSEDREHLRNAWERSVRNGSAMSEEVNLAGAFGDIRVRVCGKAKAGGGGLWSVSSLQRMRDVEEELRRTEALYNTVISNLPNGAIIVFDRNLRYQFAGGPLLKEIGLSSEDIAGRHISDVLDPGAVALMTPYYRGALEGREAAVKTDGEGGRLVMVYFLPVRMGGEGIVGGMVVGIDITEYEQSIVGLRQTEVRLEGMFSRASEGMAITDRKGIVLKWNQCMEEITGVRQEEAVGRPIWDVEFGMLMPSQKTQVGYRQLLEHHRSMLARGRSAIFSKEMTIAGQDDAQRFIEKDEFPLFGKDVEGLGIICRDITERKFAEMMLSMPGRSLRKGSGR
jgi:PAS domain S-box-containing protein